MAAAAQCSSLLCSCIRRPCTTGAPLSLFSPSHFLSRFTATPIRASPKQLKLSTSRTDRVVSAVVSAENTVQSSFSGTDEFKLTYLEGNSWLWDVCGAKILVDPILVGNLDFGIPWLYDAAKKFLKNFQGHCPDDRWDLDAKGLLASLVSAEETIESFKELLSKELPDAQVLQPTPGVPLQIPLHPNLP